MKLEIHRVDFLRNNSGFFIQCSCGYRSRSLKLAGSLGNRHAIANRLQKLGAMHITFCHAYRRARNVARRPGGGPDPGIEHAKSEWGLEEIS